MYLAIKPSILSVGVIGSVGVFWIKPINLYDERDKMYARTFFLET